MTERELEVLRYLGLGWEVVHVPTKMGLSPHTVRNRSANLRRKPDVGSSPEEVMGAVLMGILELS